MASDTELGLRAWLGTLWSLWTSARQRNRGKAVRVEGMACAKAQWSHERVQHACAFTRSLSAQERVFGEERGQERRLRTLEMIS